jgi:hypothetical protein
VDIRREYVCHAVDKPAVQFYSYDGSIPVKSHCFEAADFIASFAKPNEVERVGFMVSHSFCTLPRPGSYRIPFPEETSSSHSLFGKLEYQIIFRREGEHFAANPKRIAPASYFSMA